MTYAPPPRPWVKGVHDAYSAFTLEVQVSADPTGRVWSYHDYQTPEDERTALSLPYGGAQQIAYALLTEAYRREAFVVALAEIGREPETLRAYREGTPENRAALESRLAVAAQQVMQRTLAKMGADVPREILAMLLGPEDETR